ncbi:MAG: YggT family protein [Gemmatimonadota bacterium]|nr:MAG: YggT family protein [Gemmatimonadota bacterium]
MMVLDVVRALAFLVFVYCALVSLASWAIRTGRINQFSSIGQTVRRIIDPPLRPIEHWLVKRGANPQGAGWWLLGISVVAGIIVVTMTEWILVQTVRIASAGSRGPGGVMQLVVYYAVQLVTIALIVRVIGSWFGKGPDTGWMRPAYFLTDWIVRPLRRIVPNVGMIDITPLVAYFLLQWLVLPLLMRLFQ